MHSDIQFHMNNMHDLFIDRFKSEFCLRYIHHYAFCKTIGRNQKGKKEEERERSISVGWELGFGVVDPYRPILFHHFSYFCPPALSHSEIRFKIIRSTPNSSCS